MYFKADKIPRLDNLKAESQRMDAERLLVAARENETLAQVLLRRTIGVALDRPVRAIDELQRTLQAPPLEADVLVSVMMNNPQLARLVTQERQA